MKIDIYDDRACLLGEGPLWHPTRNELFWFDILGQKLMAVGREWAFDRAVSAAGWVDDTTLLIASEVNLFLFDIEAGTEAHLLGLEADNPVTRSNDGRADPQGGFWIGTMGHNAEAGAGALYRFFKGELRQIRDGVTIPNATCFAPGGDIAYFADTEERLVWRYTLDAEGWPDGAPEVFLDHRETGLNPDGALVDTDGRFWCAEWGASRVACYDPLANLVEEIKLPVPQPTCPAFGPDGLYVTTARKGGPDGDLDAAPVSGKTLFVSGLSSRGQAEHRVLIP